MILQVSWLVLLAAVVPLTSAATCTDLSYNWTFNALNQGPCHVAQNAAGVCDPAGLIIPQLALSNDVYYGPTKDQDDSCQCSTAFYSVVSACAACQDKKWIDWSLFKTNCTRTYSGFPADCGPSGCNIPDWAFLDVSHDDTWNVTSARDFAISSSISPGVTAPSASPSHSSHSSHTSHTGAIVGGVIGGIAALAILAVLAGRALWSYRGRPRSSLLPIPGRPTYVQLSETPSYGPISVTAPEPTFQPQRRRGL